MIDRREWHRWFAWHPQRIDPGHSHPTLFGGEWCWLKSIERKLKTIYVADELSPLYGYTDVYEYRIGMASQSVC
jgi:hypothetical protein